MAAHCRLLALLWLLHDAKGIIASYGWLLTSNLANCFALPHFGLLDCHGCMQAMMALPVLLLLWLWLSERNIVHPIGTIYGGEHAVGE